MTVRFAKPTPFWADAFVGTRGMISRSICSRDYKGAKSREAPANLKPVGTGPYQFCRLQARRHGAEARSTQTITSATGRIFDSIEMKGGGDAVSAARAVMQTGEYDYAWNMQVEDEILLRLEKGGKGRAAITPGGNIEHIQLNSTDPWTEVDGERSSIKTKHPLLSDPAVRQALGPARRSPSRCRITSTGAPASPPPTSSTTPSAIAPKNMKWEFNVDKANQLLEEAGWKKGADGIRAKDGKKLKFVYQTSINTPRQKNQAIVKQACQKAGIDVELKSVMASVFFSSDAANPDTYPHFYCDMQMYTTTMTQPDPELFMNQFMSWEVATKENKWQGRNITRWTNEEYDKAFRAAEGELDPVKRAALFIR